jgi:hypothetical protein
VEGYNVTFQCLADNSTVSVRWTLYGLAYPKEPLVELFNGSAIHPDYTNRYSLIAEGNGQYDLRLVNVSRRDAGTYVCSDTKSQNNASSASALFTVLGRLTD